MSWLSWEFSLRRQWFSHLGNAAAVHRELVEAAERGGPPAPSMATFQRAIRRDVLPGDRAGLRHGERARREYDVHLQRPATHRNAVWEADHKEASVDVVVAGWLAGWRAGPVVDHVVRRQPHQRHLRDGGHAGPAEQGEHPDLLFALGLLPEPTITALTSTADHGGVR